MDSLTWKGGRNIHLNFLLNNTLAYLLKYDHTSNTLLNFWLSALSLVLIRLCILIKLYMITHLFSHQIRLLTEMSGDILCLGTLFRIEKVWSSFFPLSFLFILFFLQCKRTIPNFVPVINTIKQLNVEGSMKSQATASVD